MFVLIFLASDQFCPLLSNWKKNKIYDLDWLLSLFVLIPEWFSLTSNEFIDRWSDHLVWPWDESEIDEFITSTWSFSGQLDLVLKDDLDIQQVYM